MNNTPTSSGLPAAALRGLRAGTVVLLAGWLALPSEAAQSNPTGGRIQGRAPEATGTLSILMPDGTTPLVNNAKVSADAKPNEFTLGPLTTLTYSDLDGDAPAGTGITLTTPPGVTWVWKKGTQTLTAAQLNQPFKTNFPTGTKLTVSATVPLEVTSVSGTPQTFTKTIDLAYTVETKLPPVIQVNGYNFAMNSGFPKTGFVGAKFVFYMNGTDGSANNRYIYTTSQPGWTSVSTTGNVTFTRMPMADERVVTISITDTSGNDTPQTHTFGTESWFTNKRTLFATKSSADSQCAAMGNGYATPPRSSVSNAGEDGNGNASSRAANGRLWSEWGSLLAYAGSGFDGDQYWTSDDSNTVPPYRLEFVPSNGAIGYDPTSNGSYVMCLKRL